MKVTFYLYDFFARNPTNKIGALLILDEMIQKNNGQPVPSLQVSRELSTRFQIRGRDGLQGMAPLYRYWVRDGILTRHTDESNRNLILLSIGPKGKILIQQESADRSKAFAILHTLGAFTRTRIR